MRKLIQTISATSLAIFILTSTQINAQEVTVQGPANGPPDCGQWLSHQHGSIEGEWYKSWLMGFLSGFSVGRGKNYLGGTSATSTFFWMDKYCRENPLNTTIQGSAALINELRKQKGMQ